MAGAECRWCWSGGHRTEVVEPLEVFTVEEMMPRILHLKGAQSRDLFLKNKTKGYWLVTVPHNRQINSNEPAKQLGVGRENLQFADETSMLEKLKAGQGCAHPWHSSVMMAMQNLF